MWKSLALLLLSISSFGQMINTETYLGLSSAGVLRFNNWNVMSAKVTEHLEYSEVKGRCFWKEDWNPAILVLLSGAKIKLNKVKLNFYSDNVHFMNEKGEEMVAQIGIKFILMMNTVDSSKATAVFQNLKTTGVTSENIFAEILNEGNYKLLKREQVSLGKKEKDPITGRSDYYRYENKVSYFLLYNGIARPLIDLSKRSIFATVKETKEIDDWLTANKNKLKKEKEVIKFIQYLNSI